MNHPLRNKLFRRITAAVLAVLMLAPLVFSAPETAEASPVPDGTTSTITIYRWDLISDPNTYFRSGNDSNKLLTTWLDNGAWYYWRGYQSKWEGSYYEGKLILKDNLLSQQPLLDEAIHGKCPSFISNTDMGIRLSISAHKPDLFIYDGSSGEQAICYNYTNSSKASGMNFDALSKDDRGFGDIWLPQESGFVQLGTSYAKTMKIRSYAEFKPDKGYTYLRHSGNVIYAGKSGDEASATFSTFYAGSEVKISAIQKNYSITNGQVLPVENTIYIPKGVTLTVKNGGTLSVGGQLLNDGKIVVEKGGLLVVKERATVMPLSRSEPDCGALVSDGTVVVRKNAKLIGGGTTGLWFSSGGVTNFGMMASENFRATQTGIIENRTGGQIYAGKTIGSPKFYECVCAYLDKKTPAANSTIAESDFQTKQPSGAVLFTDGAVTNKGGTLKNFGSFGAQGSSVVNVYVESDGMSGTWENVVTALESEMNYYQSEEMHVTNREIMDTLGITAQLREQYVADHGSEEGFEQYLTEYAATAGMDLNAWVNVYNGIFTVNGRIVYTVPWYRMMRVTKGGDVLQADAYPWQVTAIWGDGARPADAPDEFADAPLLDKTFFVELASAPGMRLEVAGGGVKDGDNVRIWSAQNANHMRWSFRKGEVLYRNGEKLYYYYIVNLNSGMVLHITSGNYAAEGQNIRQSAKNNAPYQQLFRVEQNSDGTYRIIPRGNDAYSMETNNGGTSNGSNVQVGTFGGDAARWNLIKTEESPYVGKTFELEPVCAPGMRLEIKNGSTYYGPEDGNAQIGTYDPNAAHQRWRFDKAEIVYENGEMYYYYFLVPTQWKHQLTTATLPAKHGNNVYQGKANNNTARQWRIVDNGDGTVGIVPRTNSALMLNVAGGGTDPGTNVNVWNNTNFDPQKWWIFPVGGSRPDDAGWDDSIPGDAVFHNKSFEIESVAAPGMLAEVENGSTLYGGKSGKVLLGEDTDQNYQRWRFQYVETVEEDGNSFVYYYIVAEHSGHVLMPDNSYRAADGTKVVQGKLDMYPEQQKWRVVDNGDGTYGLVTKLVQGVPEVRLSLKDGSADIGTQLITAATDGSDAQKWKLNPVG